VGVIAYDDSLPSALRTSHDQLQLGPDVAPRIHRPGHRDSCGSERVG
jgi:hypothetical protein